MKMRLVLAQLASLLFAFASSPSHAADLPVKYKAPPPPVASWTGFYVGGELGGKWETTSWSTTSLRDPPFVFGSIVLPPDASQGRHYDPSSVRAGIYAGYNWQVTPLWVLGIEGDGAWADGKVTASGFPGCALGPCTFPGSGFNAPVDTTSLAMRWDASLRGRVGYLITPTFMLYGTGGVAFQNISASGICGNLLQSFYCNGAVRVGINPSAITNDTTLVGGTVGAGGEWMLGQHWVWRGEYRFSDFGTHNDVFAFGFSPVAGDNTYRYKLSTQTHIVTVGLGYKF